MPEGYIGVVYSLTKRLPCALSPLPHAHIKVQNVRPAPVS